MESAVMTGTADGLHSIKGTRLIPYKSAEVTEML